MVLAGDEGEAVPELEQEGLQPVDQRDLEVAFGDRAGEVEEVQDVGVAGELLGQLRVGGQRSGEVGWSGAGPLVQLVQNLVEQHVPGPAVFHGGGGVPVAGRLVVEPVEQRGDVSPGQLSNGLLDDCRPRPGGGERPHVEQIAAGQALHLGEGGAQVGGEPVDDPGFPSLRRAAAAAARRRCASTAGAARC